MGLAYTIDSPVKVARFGISSVISIVEDHLIEMMRKHYYPVLNREYFPISTNEEDYRAKRITDYLNLIQEIVQQQVEKIRQAVFDKGSELVKYFEMLPGDSYLRQLYIKMTETTDPSEKNKLQLDLRNQVKPGSIDVNIMTKTDRDQFTKDDQLIENGSDAVSALRGFANSKLANASVVFSAGMNPRLYNYLSTCPAFDVNEDGEFSKKVIIKVSDYRSALIQGKYLAKKGIWVSEFRIESGLNCGGHAFATEGHLMGPILEEFKLKKQELTDTLFELYNAALFQKTNKRFKYPPVIRISAQGGIGTNEENELLLQHYQVDSTGWGTPFLLVPEATTVDDETLALLCAAKEKDVVLSHRSPLGVRFHYLSGTSADKERQQRIKQGKPGSPCTEKFLGFNTEFTKEPICTASRKYQQLKIASLKVQELPAKEYDRLLNEVLEKECLCIGLSNAASIRYQKVFVKNLPSVNICPGPNIANFSKIVSLQTMTDHIYGRTNIMTNADRPHMFIAELRLYVKYLEEQLQAELQSAKFDKRLKYFKGFYNNLQIGIDYYKLLNSSHILHRERFLQDLKTESLKLDQLAIQYHLTDHLPGIKKASSLMEEPAV